MTNQDAKKLLDAYDAAGSRCRTAFRKAAKSNLREDWEHSRALEQERLCTRQGLLDLLAGTPPPAPKDAGPDSRARHGGRAAGASNEA